MMADLALIGFVLVMLCFTVWPLFDDKGAR